MLTSVVPPIEVAPSTVSFADYQAIHQEQQRRRYPAQPAPKPETADPWKVKAQRWAYVLAAGAFTIYWTRSVSWLGWALLITIFMLLGLLHQWWEYRQAYRQGPDKQLPTSFVADTHGIHITQNGRRFYRWNEFYSIQAVQHWLLLYTSVEHCYYLDLNQIEPPATAADLLALLPRPVTAPQ
ncbi:hypothetical protein LGH70_08950 [Hymenobacter sp. BT635]|uniref:YcxB-like protein domain-containing protein n=1 Tax=Hymenobacter nitidus TaxID=2880929 RepID=A0ABS8ACP4_9BACT|nr:hypothetical protein [Hymenobacter nitidus]MCB2377707.1 hypothetical protein [Hymenobacter nitidus]